MTKTRFFIGFAVILATLFSLITGHIASADWQIQYVGEAARMFGSAPRGMFANQAECLGYWRSQPPFERNHSSCVGSDRPGTGSTFTPVPSYRVSPSQQMALGIVGGLFNNLFSGMFDESPSGPSAGNAYQEQLQRQQQEQMQRQQAMDAAIAAWKKDQEQAAQDALKEQQKNREQGALLIAKMDGGLTGGRGKLEPMWIAQTPEPTPLEPGGYSTSHLNPTERLYCASYFTDRAQEETINGNHEGARYFREQADRVMVGAKVDEEGCTGYQTEFPTPRATAVEQMAPAKFLALMDTFKVKLTELQQLETALIKARQERRTAADTLKQREERLTEIQSQARSARTREEKAQADALAVQALAQKDAADAQVHTAQQAEQALINQAKDVARAISALSQSIPQGAAK